MKKVLFALLLAALLLVSVLVVRTITFESQQIQVDPAEPASVNGPQVAEQLSKALQFKTISLDRKSVV